MDVTGTFFVVALAVGATMLSGGYSTSPTVNASDIHGVEQQQIVTASADAKLVFQRNEVNTIAAPPKTAPPTEQPVPVPVAVVLTPPVVQAPTQIAPLPAPVPTTLPFQSPIPEVVSREVYVGIAGGQKEIDLGQGPVLFRLAGGFPPYVAEHDFAGGWARFGTLSAGMTVRMSGLVVGTYTVGQIINVPKNGSTNEFSKFNVLPKVMLQTCIPGTDRMIIVGLY